MGLSLPRFLCPALLAGCILPALIAAPQLRLVNAAVGPVSVAQGANGPVQTVEAYNIGDGNLSLSATSSASWASPSVGAPRACSTQPGVCIPIQIALNTASLARGAFTSIVTVRDPNAIDAPQTITVTVQVGGGVPDRIQLYVPPDGSADEVRFATNSQLSLTPATQSGGDWLTATLDGAGSFRFVYPWVVRASHQPGMAEGSYTGTVTVANSAFAPDNKSIPVSLTVTSRPIATVTPQRLRLRVAQNAPRQWANLIIGNRGMGTLAISGAAATTASGGNWLEAERIPGYDIVQVKVTSGTLANGVYQGTVTVTTNAANASLSVPVELEVVPQAAPWAYFQGAVNNATYEAGEAVPQGGLVALYGEQFSFGDPATPTALPLPDSLGGVQVLLNDQSVPLFYTSYGQINFQVPYSAQPGPARVRVVRDRAPGNQISVEITSRAPRLLRLGIGNYGIVVNQDGSFPIKTTPGVNTRPAKSGDVLVMYAIGLGPTSPPAGTGQAAPDSPLAQTPDTLVFFGSSGITAGVPVTPIFAGLTPRFVGLYQINVVVPEDPPKGDRVPVRIVTGGAASNSVEIAIQ